MNPRVLKQEGFHWLDRVIDICAQERIYTIIDLHAAAGGQNTVRIFPSNMRYLIQAHIRIGIRIILHMSPASGYTRIFKTVPSGCGSSWQITIKETLGSPVTIF
jgi:hypothetical protein